MTKKSSSVIIRKGTGEMTRVIVTGGVLRIVFVIDNVIIRRLDRTFKHVLTIKNQCCAAGDNGFAVRKSKA